MSNILLKPILLVLGLTCVYLATFLYEDEEGQIQNYLEDWWLRIRYRAERATSGSVAFVHVVCEVVASGFDRMFGDRLLSSRAIAVSICYSLASIASYSVLQCVNDHCSEWVLASVVALWWLYLCGLSWFVSTGGSRLFWTLFAAGIVLTTWAASDLWEIVIFAAIRDNESLGWMGLAVAPVVILGSDVCFVILARSLARRGCTVTHVDAFGLIALVGAIISIGFVVVPLYLANVLFEEADNLAWALSMVITGMSNLVSAILGLALVAMSALLLMHRVLWPLIDRPLYALGRLGVHRRKRMMWAVGLSLIGGANPWLEHAMGKLAAALW